MSYATYVCITEQTCTQCKQTRADHFSNDSCLPIPEHDTNYIRPVTSPYMSISCNLHRNRQYYSIFYLSPLQALIPHQMWILQYYYSISYNTPDTLEPTTVTAGHRLWKHQPINRTKSTNRNKHIKCSPLHQYLLIIWFNQLVSVPLSLCVHFECI